MNKIVKISLVVFVVLAFAGVGIYLKLFKMGSKDFSSIRINQVMLGSEDVTVTGEIMDSASAFKDFNFELLDQDLYITINTVLASKEYNDGTFEIVLPIDGFSLQNIYLSDGENIESIYSASSVE